MNDVIDPSSHAVRAGGPPSRGEWLAIVVAIAIAHGFYWHLVLYPSAADAQSYLDIASEIERRGLFTKFQLSEVRTYGYPLSLAVLDRSARLIGVPWGTMIFEIQLALYLGTAWVVRRGLATFSTTVARWAFIAVATNVFALSYTPESLTESVSLSLLLLAAGLWLRLQDGDPRPWLRVGLGSLVVGAAVEVRPANLFAVVAWVIAVGAAGVASRLSIRAWSRLLVAGVIGILLPMIPQVSNNLRFYGKATPLLAADLGTDQQRWGVAYLKYATALPPVPRAAIYYLNPYAAGRPVRDADRPLLWYLDYPVAGARTLGLHVFAMVDQDLFFTYSRDLDPWYRPLLGIANHALLALALLGAVFLARRARRSRQVRVAAIALAAFVLAHIGLHATTAVEMRFGLPLLLIAGPLAVLAIHDLEHERPVGRSMAAIFFVAYVIAALALSNWVRQQAPDIRARQISAAHHVRDRHVDLAVAVLLQEREHR